MKRRKNKPLVVIGLLGVNLDSGARNASRWDRWRPSVSICQQEELLVSRFELLHARSHSRLAQQVREDIGTVSPESRVNLHLSDPRNPWDFEEVYASLYDFAHAYLWKPDSEEYLIHITTGTHVAQICLFLLTESRHFPAKLLQTSPPQNSRTGEESGAPGTYAIIDLDLSKYDRLAARFDKTFRDDLAFLKSGIETRNPAFNRLIERIEKVAARSIEPILLIGPTGAGKSQLGRRIYDLKKNRRLLSGRFVEVNCATLRGDQAMAALFGHAKGAFTGASSNREGLLRSADGGMLFLDEIGELGLDEQAMLLRAIEEKNFLPLGSDRESTSDFQLIAGTNRDLSRAVREGRFRHDLLARINLWTFALPGLAERPEDISPNLDYELERASERLGRRVTMNREAREEFLAFAESPRASWLANFRDLGGAVSRMATLAEGGRIDVPDVEAETALLLERWRGGEGDAKAEGSDAVLSSLLGPKDAAGLDRFDVAQLAEVVKVCRESRTMSEAGRTLFDVSRTRRKSTNDADRLKKYLARFGLEWGDVR